MTTLRQQYIEELVLRGLAERTQEAYIHQVYHLAKYYRRSPDTLTEAEVHAYMIHLAMERQWAASSINQAVNAFRFFYQHVAPRDWVALRQALPFARRSIVRAQVFSIEQLERLFTVGCDQPRDRAFLMTVYGGGLRLNEACHLRVTDLQGDRQQIRVVQGKGKNYAKVVVMQRWVFLNRAESIFALQLAWGWGRRKTGGIYEKRVFFRFCPDKAAVQEPLGSSAHGRQLPWHKAHSLCIGFARSRVHA